MDDTPTPFAPFPMTGVSQVGPMPLPVEPPKQRRKRRTKAEIEAARLSAGKKRRPYIRRHPPMADKHTAIYPQTVIEPPANDVPLSTFAKIVCLVSALSEKGRREVIAELAKIFP